MSSSSKDHMDTDGSHSGDENDGSDSASGKYVRGAALLKKIRALTVQGTKKIPLKLNSLGKPIGKHSTLFENYVGYLSRDRVSIEYTTWKKVPMKTKIAIYDHLMITFDINHQKMTKKMILTNIGNKWRTFKVNLGKLMKDKKTGQIYANPPKCYPSVHQDAWDAYVKHRSTKEFQDISNANRERSLKKQYPYLCSSMGYARLEEKMLTANNLDPEIESISRADLWKAARCDENGIYVDPETRQVAEKIDTIKDQVSKGDIKLGGREDILSLALEKDEHPGRLRGVGFGVGVKAFFGPSNRSNHREENISLRAAMLSMQQRLEKLEKQAQEKHGIESQGSAKQQLPPATNEGSEYESPIRNLASSKTDPSHGDPSKLTDNARKCILAWPDRACVVAKGLAYIPKAGLTETLHGQELEANVLRVGIQNILKDKAKVPFPTDEVPFLSEDSLGNIVKWPKHLVLYEKDCRKALFQPSAKKTRTPDPQPKHPSLDKFTVWMTSSKDFVVKIDMKREVVQHTHKLDVFKEDILSWLARGELDGVHISMYIKFLFYEMYNSQYKFLCPSRVSFLSKSSDDPKLDSRVRYLVSSMRDSNGCLWFLPYHEAYHWMLAVINPAINTIYWLDPMRQGVKASCKQMCETALIMMNTTRGSLSKASQLKITWKTIECPEQPDNTSCGFYVCRFMREIVQAGVMEIPTSYLSQSPQVYTKSHMLEVVEECLQYFQQIFEWELKISR